MLNDIRDNRRYARARVSGKPPWYIRMFCRKVPQNGFVQRCHGIAKGWNNIDYALYYVGPTPEITHSELAKLVVKYSTTSMKFRPNRYTAIYPYVSPFYAPVWSGDFWKKEIV